MAFFDVFRDDWCRYLMRSRVASLSLALLLCSCGGGDDGGSTVVQPPQPPTPPSPSQPVQAVNGFAAVQPGELTQVDLSKFVRGEEAALTDVVSDQQECNTPEISGLKASFTVDGSTLCRYNFTVSSGRSQARAMLSLLASGASTPILAPLSHAMVLNPSATPPQAASFDLTTLLGADFPTGGYALDAASVVVDGGTAQGTASVAGNIITYTPPTSSDWNRISFVLKDPAQPTKDVLGTIYVTIADRLNQAPIIAVPKYDYVAQNPSAPIYNMESATLNLGTLPNLNIVDPDGDAWDVEDVLSYSATVTKSGKNIIFTGAAGNHIVSYLVRDDKGGFRVGLINVKVVHKERVKDWVDITIGDKTFFATPMYSEVQAKGVGSGAYWDSGVNTTSTPPGNTIATVTGATANSYCAGSGYRLATQSNLDLLRSTTSASVTLSKYPKQQQYAISNDGVNYKSYNLSTGAVSSSSSMYVICVKYDGDGKIAYKANINTPMSGYTNTVISNNASSWQALGTIATNSPLVEPLVLTSTINNGSINLTSGNFRLNPAGCAGGRCLLEARAGYSEYGSTSLILKSLIDPADTITIGPITFLRDMKVGSVAVVSNGNKANGVAMNTVMVRYVRNNGTPLVNETLNLSVSAAPSSVFFGSGRGNGDLVTTNSNGEVTIPLRYFFLPGGVVTVTANSGPNTIPTSGSVASTFASGMCSKGDILVGTNGRQYTCPLTANEAAVAGIGVVGTHIENNTNYAGLDITTAINYCNGLSPVGSHRVPTINELYSLYDNYGSYVIPRDKWWPYEWSYWSSDSWSVDPTWYHYIGIHGRGTNVVPGNTGNYVTCIR